MSRSALLATAWLATALASHFVVGRIDHARAASLPEAGGNAAQAMPLVERALVLHDPASAREELVWSFEPRDPSKASVQILPFPTKPEVSALADDALDALVDAYPPFGTATSGLPGASGGKRDEPRAARAAITPPSWKIFAPGELGALREHLAEFHHPVDGATDAWLAAASARGFHFVVVRRPARPSRAAGVDASEAPRPSLLRFGFEAAAPYLPYGEPSPPPSAGRGRGRSLSAWLLSPIARSPVALYQASDEVRVVRPLREGSPQTITREEATKLLGAKLAAALPKGAQRIELQRFVDQKSSREGFGDVVFVPRAAVETLKGDGASIAPLLGALGVEPEASR